MPNLPQAALPCVRFLPSLFAFPNFSLHRTPTRLRGGPELVAKVDVACVTCLCLHRKPAKDAGDGVSHHLGPQPPSIASSSAHPSASLLLSLGTSPSSASRWAALASMNFAYMELLETVSGVQQTQLLQLLWKSLFPRQGHLALAQGGIQVA